MTHESELKILNLPMNKLHQLDNSRVHYHLGDLSDLMYSIKQHGLMQPIGVREHPSIPEEWEILYGNRRYLAYQKLGRGDIPCIIVETDNATDFISKNLVENLQRVNLSPFEEGRYFQELIRLGLSIAEIAARVNVSDKRVRTHLVIYNHVPEEFRDIIGSGSIGRGERKGRINAEIASKVVTKAHKMKRTRKEISELLRSVKDHELNMAQVGKTIELMKKGLNIKAAIESVTILKPITLNFLMSESKSAELELRYGKSARQILTDTLANNPEFGLTVHGRKLVDQEEEEREIS